MLDLVPARASYGVAHGKAQPAEQDGRLTLVENAI
jgi:hypothetical protein